MVNPDRFCSTGAPESDPFDTAPLGNGSNVKRRDVVTGACTLVASGLSLPGAITVDSRAARRGSPRTVRFRAGPRRSARCAGRRARPHMDRD